MGSLFLLIPLLLALVFVRLLIKPNTRNDRRENQAPPQPRKPPTGWKNRLGSAMASLSSLSFSACLLFSVAATFMLCGSRGEDVEITIIVAAFCYCGAAHTFRGWRPPKIVPGGWKGNARHELRWLMWAYVAVLAPLVSIGGVKLVLHATSVDLTSIASYVSLALLALGFAWVVQYMPLPDEKLTLDQADSDQAELTPETPTHTAQTDPLR